MKKKFFVCAGKRHKTMWKACGLEYLMKEIIEEEEKKKNEDNMC